MKVASLAAIQQPALLIFVRDHRQTPGGLSKGKAPKGMAAAVACVLLIVQGLPPTCSEIGAEHLEMPCQIFNIFGRVVALGHTYFRVLCCCLSMFLASVLVRVLHPCVALALWKLLRTVGAVDGL